MTMTAEQKLSKAKSKLILYQPFFASILCNLPMYEDNTIPTMATNGRCFRWNREFVDNMSPEETEFVLCHEVGHCMFGHMFRRGTRTPRRWNMAGDYIINDLLRKENNGQGIGTMPQGGLHNPQLVIAGNGCAEGVYTLLPESDDDGRPGDGNTGIDCCEDAGGDAADQAAAEAEMKVAIAQAAQAAKMCGKLSNNMARFVEAAIQPRVNWKDVLRRFVSARAKVDLTYAKPKRRWLADDLILPSLSGERMGEIADGIDCSGSIGQHELNIFGAEMTAIKEDMKPSMMHNIYFDSDVCHYDKFGPDEDMVIAPHGGGGTRFSPIFKFIDDQGIEPVCAVILTDLCCSDYGPPPPYPVLWISTSPKGSWDNVPWGEVVYMDMRDR